MRRGKSTYIISSTMKKLEKFESETSQDSGGNVTETTAEDSEIGLGDSVYEVVRTAADADDKSFEFVRPDGESENGDNENSVRASNASDTNQSPVKAFLSPSCSSASASSNTWQHKQRRVPPPPPQSAARGRRRRQQLRKPLTSTSRNVDLAEVLGCRIELKWSSGNWYRGTITMTDPTKGAKVCYDDGDIKWYHLPEMVFRFINEVDEFEWVDEQPSAPLD